MEQNQDTTNDRQDAENRRKLSQNSSREGSQDAQNRSQHPSPSTLERRQITWWPTVRQKVAKVGRKSAQRGQSGTQVGPKNRPKSTPDRQKCFPRWRRKRFSSISCAISVRSHIPNRFWEGLNLQNPIISTVGARFSQNRIFHFFLDF